MAPHIARSFMVQILPYKRIRASRDEGFHRLCSLSVEKCNHISSEKSSHRGHLDSDCYHSNLIRFVDRFGIWNAGSTRRRQNSPRYYHFTQLNICLNCDNISSGEYHCWRGLAPGEQGLLLEYCCSRIYFPANFEQKFKVNQLSAYLRFSFHCTLTKIALL